MRPRPSISRRDFLVSSSLVAASITVSGTAQVSKKTSSAPTRLYRLNPDSSILKAPRVFARVFCEPEALGKTVKFYEALTNISLDQDMDIPEARLHVVAVGGFLILALDPKKLDPAKHGEATKITTTVLVAHLDEVVAEQVANGATIVQPRWTVPPGAGFRLRHPDGLLVEYVEHRPSPYDVGEPGPLFR